MPVPDFSPGEVLTAAAMDSIGLWLVKTQTVGTAVSSVTVTGAFSADYNNYKITWDGIVNSSAGNLNFQLSGITGNVYSTGGSFYTYGSSVVTGFGPAPTSTWLIGPAGAFNSSGYADLSAPNLARRKSMLTQATSTLSYYSFAHSCDSTSVATGFVISPNTGTMTGGTIRVYGYRN
jgi:hypothetical protein